ncbi:MazG nucleotide pyrophosphohydrolase domain-containing protein [Nanoarchaeota archaeon]
MKEIQQRIKQFCETHGMSSSPEHRALDMMSEMGEVAKELLKMTDYGTKEREFREEMKGELGDLLFSLVTLANSMDVDLSEALEAVLAKYEKRIEKGSAGSENE